MKIFPLGSREEEIEESPRMVLPVTCIRNLKIENSINAHVGPTIVAENLHVHAFHILKGETVQESAPRFTTITRMVRDHKKQIIVLNMAILTLLTIGLTSIPSLITSESSRPRDLFNRSLFSPEERLQLYYPTEEIVDTLSSTLPSMLPLKNDRSDVIMIEDIRLKSEIMKSYFQIDERGASKLSLDERKKRLADIFKRRPLQYLLWDIPLGVLMIAGKVRSEKRLRLFLGRGSEWELVCWIPQPGEKHYNKSLKGWAMVTLSPVDLDNVSLLRLAYSLEVVKWGQHQSSPDRAWPVWLILSNTSLAEDLSFFSFSIDEVSNPRNGYVDPSSAAPYYHLRLYLRFFAIY